MRAWLYIGKVRLVLLLVLTYPDARGRVADAASLERVVERSEKFALVSGAKVQLLAAQRKAG